jgi:uncharacterized protein (TIGR02646 family)
MRHFDKSQVPDFFTQAVKQVKQPQQHSAWDDSAIQAVKHQLRVWMLSAEQQANMCAYCETKVSVKNSHIDHFRTRNHLPEETLSFNNLWVSCNADHHCAKHKDRAGLTRQALIELPRLSDIDSQQIEFACTGEVFSDNEQINNLIQNVLNLNAPSLIEERKNLLKQLKNYQDFTLDEVFACFGYHLSAISQCFEQDKLHANT